MPELIPSPDQKEVTRLQNSIIDEILFALGMSRTGWARNLFGPLFILAGAPFCFHRGLKPRPWFLRSVLG